MIKLGQAVVVKTAQSFNGSSEQLAIVNKVWHDFPQGSLGGAAVVNLCVLPDCGSPFTLTSVTLWPSKPATLNANGTAWLA